LLVGVVAGADKGAGLDVAEAHAEGFGFEIDEFSGRVEAGHGQVVARGAQVLADGEDVAVDGGEVAEDREEFVGLFAETDHDSGFCNAGGVEFFGVAEELESAFIAGTGADGAVKARHGFGVVVEHFRFGVDYNFDGFAIALEVGDEDLDAAAGGLLSNLLNDHREDACSAKEVVITIDTGDDGVFETESGDGFSYAAGLVEVDGFGAAFGDGAESAPAGAEVAEQHEGGGFVMPALADIRALGAFADRVQAEGACEALERVVVLADGSAGLEPFRLGSRDAASGLDLDEVHLWVL